MSNSVNVTSDANALHGTSGDDQIDAMSGADSISALAGSLNLLWDIAIFLIDVLRDGSRQADMFKSVNVCSAFCAVN